MQNETPKSPKKAAAKKAAPIKTEAIETPKKTTKTATKKAAVKKAATPKKVAKKTEKATPVTVTFKLAYSTQFGQNIFISGNAPQLGNNRDENALRLEYIDAEHWAAEVQLNKNDLTNDGLTYHYIIQHEDGNIEKSAAYHLLADELTDDIYVSDAWNYSGFVQNEFSTKVFDILGTKAKAKKASSKKATHTFKIKAPVLSENQAVFLSGNCGALGNWDLDNIILLAPEAHSGAWVAHVNLSADNNIVEYKYGLYDLENKTLLAYEEGSNRAIETQNIKSVKAIINDGFIRGNN